MSRVSEKDAIRRHLQASAELKRRVADTMVGEIAAAVDLMAEALRSGGQVLFCGNGGSAADSQHLATELTSRLSPELDRPALPALALTTDTSFLTAHANDFSFGDVFRRQVEGLGREGDLLVGISTSGNSENVIRGAEAARSSGLHTLGMLGGERGRLADLVDVALVVPSTDTQIVQEAHITLGHVIVALVERRLFRD